MTKGQFDQPITNAYETQIHFSQVFAKTFSGKKNTLADMKKKPTRSRHTPRRIDPHQCCGRLAQLGEEVAPIRRGVLGLSRGVALPVVALRVGAK